MKRYKYKAGYVITSEVSPDVGAIRGVLKRWPIRLFFLASVRDTMYDDQVERMCRHRPRAQSTPVCVKILTGPRRAPTQLTDKPQGAGKTQKHNRDTLSLPVDTCDCAGRRRRDGGHLTAVGAHGRGRNVAEGVCVNSL